LLEPQRLTNRYHTTRKLTAATVKELQTTIINHYHLNPRTMAWRNTRDPYPILVSEFMLQQTQVERVKIKFEQFMARFPTLVDLADAALPDVLTVWQGLGYNRRAIALKHCADEVAARLGGNIPTSIQELESLPGIGPYTARAVAAFAFNIAEPLIETNIRAVFIHFFFHGRELVSDHEILPLVTATLDRANPREWYYALMDYGGMLKQKHSNPARRSNRHVKQSRFAGSNRQLRSFILKTLLNSPGLSPSDLATRLEADEDAVKNNLEAMVREGFLEQISFSEEYRVKQQ
jgi:A/G-specific adenine glycosylase